MATKKRNGRQITKLSITHSFLELQSLDFAWKFVWADWTNFDLKKIKWPPNHKIEHNSLISWATESRFRMEVQMDRLKKFWFFLNKKTAKKQNGRQITKLSINHSFIELQSPDFSWKFIWAVPTNYEKLVTIAVSKL